MKTLIIHPKDESTDFLKVIYEGMKDITVLTGDGINQEELRTIIPDYDRVMIMGHGSPYGLLTAGGFVGFRGHIIDNTFVKLLQNNPNNVYIWCNADVFVNQYNLQGFHTGMFISEVGEALYFRIITDQETVDQSNYGFCEMVRKYRTRPSSEIYRNVKRLYGEMAKTNEVADYNYNRLYYKESLYKVPIKV
jgi:hypothetical protein